jgi:hypothetical protein
VVQENRKKCQQCLCPQWKKLFVPIHVLYSSTRHAQSVNMHLMEMQDTCICHSFKRCRACEDSPQGNAGHMLDTQEEILSSCSVCLLPSSFARANLHSAQKSSYSTPQSIHQHGGGFCCWILPLKLHHQVSYKTWKDAALFIDYLVAERTTKSGNLERTQRETEKET